MKRIAILASGNGSNLQAIIDATRDGRLNAAIELVVSDNAGAFALERARRNIIRAVHFPYPSRSEGHEKRRQRDAELADLLARSGTEYVVLAGWMRLLSNEFIRRFPQGVINLHPALPGAFPGTHAIERALSAFKSGQIQETGVMVHWVTDEAVDAGPVIRFESVPILSTDDLDRLANRIHATEHRILIEALASVL